MAQVEGLSVSTSVPRAPTVLVVEDTQDVLDLLVELLALEGYFVIRATNGTEALDALRRYPVDVVLLDLMMPELNGWDLLQALRTEAVTASPAVIVMTAAYDLRMVHRDPLVRAILPKPFDLEHALALVNTVMQRR